MAKEVFSRKLDPSTPNAFPLALEYEYRFKSEEAARNFEDTMSELDPGSVVESNGCCVVVRVTK